MDVPLFRIIHSCWPVNFLRMASSACSYCLNSASLMRPSCSDLCRCSPQSVPGAQEPPRAALPEEELAEDVRPVEDHGVAVARGVRELRRERRAGAVGPDQLPAGLASFREGPVSRPERILSAKTPPVVAGRASLATTPTKT